MENSLKRIIILEVKYSLRQMRELEKVVRHQSMTTNGVAREPLVVRRVIASEGDKELKLRAVAMITAMTKNSADFKFRRV